MKHGRISQSLVSLRKLVDDRVEKADHGKGAADDGAQGRDEIVPPAARGGDHHGHGRQVVGELGLRNFLLLVVHHLALTEHLVAEDVFGFSEEFSRRAVLRAHHLAEVVEDLVVLRVHVRVAVEGRRVREVLLELLQFLLLVHEKRRPEGQMIHNVGEIGHGCVQVVALAPSLNVEVPRHAIDIEGARDHAAWVILVLCLDPLHSLRVPVLHPGLELQLVLRVLFEGRHGAILLVVGLENLAVLEEPQSWKGLDALLHAHLPVRHAVNPGHIHLEFIRCAFEAFELLGEGLPGRLQPLAPDAPWCVEVHKGEPVFLEELVKALIVQWNGVDAIHVQLFDGRVVRVVRDVLLLPIPSTEDTANPPLVQLPLFNVLRDILSVGAEHIVDIHNGVVAVQVHQSDVEVYAQLRVCVRVEYHRRLRRG
mmetsp:Transcript_17548/g.51361  ORF Transcript_17548/g.51361 Transcript_17548/m.51361 type:complete len:423 (-) Transcript_17548:196-1464(-)